MKECGKCNESKSLDEFAWRSIAKGTKNWACKECQAKMRKENYEKNKERELARAKTRRQSIVDKIWKWKCDHRCVDCKFDNPKALQFDHLPEFEKSFDISKAPELGYSWNKILAEINKCEVVCANCHSIRTHDRAEWIRNLNFNAEPFIADIVFNG